MPGNDFPFAIEAGKKGIQTAQDPVYSQLSRYCLGTAYALNGRFQEAEEALQEVEFFCRDFGFDVFGTPTHGLLGLVSIAKGRMGEGLWTLVVSIRQKEEATRPGIVIPWPFGFLKIASLKCI